MPWFKFEMFTKQLKIIVFIVLADGPNTEVNYFNDYFKQFFGIYLELLLYVLCFNKSIKFVNAVIGLGSIMIEATGIAQALPSVHVFSCAMRSCSSTSSAISILLVFSRGSVPQRVAHSTCSPCVSCRCKLQTIVCEVRTYIVYLQYASHAHGRH